MADLLEFGPDSSPRHEVVAQESEKAKPDSSLSSFDPLAEGSTFEVPAPAPTQAGGLPKAVLEAFNAADKTVAALAAPAESEYLESGLSVDGQNALMKQIEESAKQMSVGKDAFSAFDDLVRAGA